MRNNKRSLLYIDMAYTYDMIKAKKHFEFLESRHSDGYFDKVWGVHPMADVGSGQRTTFRVIEHSPRQTIVEGVAESLSLPRFLLPLNFLFSQLKLAKYLVKLVRQHDISLIAATDPFYGGLLGLYLKRKCKKPLAIFVYGNYDDIYAEKKQLAFPKLIPFRWLEVAISRKIFHNCDIVVGGTRNYLDYARNNGAAGKLGMVSPFSKNMSRYHLRPLAEREAAEAALERLGIPLRKKYLISVARLEAVKHTDDAVKAMKVVMDKDPEVVGIMAGDGSMRAELEQMAKDLGISDRVFFTGNLDQKTLSEIIPQCITLSPLTGMALVECGLGGSPAVAYHRDWQPDFIKDDVNGYIVPYKDYKAMGERALHILNDIFLRAKLSAAMRQKAFAYADTETLYRQEHDVFDQLFAAVEKPGAKAARPQPVGG